MANLYQRSEEPLNTWKQKNDFLDDQWRDTMRDWLACQQTEQGARVQATRSLFGEPVTIIDQHIHSDHSDGRSRITQNRDAGLGAGIDIVFATDHNSLTQKRAVKSIPSMSWGQEPKTLHHHIGLLGNTRWFKTRRDRVDLDMERARKLAPFCWIPHPAGWFTKDYTDRGSCKTLVPQSARHSLALQIMRNKRRSVYWRANLR